MRPITIQSESDSSTCDKVKFRARRAYERSPIPPLELLLEAD